MSLASVIRNLAAKVFGLMARNKSTTKTCSDGTVVRFNQRCPIVTSGGTSGQTPLAPVNTSLPAISGTVQKGVSLTCSTGGWDDAPTSFAYQWKVAGVTAGTGSSYTIKAADVGSTITCVVTASNLGGSASATASAVGPVVDLAPVNTIAPATSGTATTGQTVSVTTGAWTNSPTSYAYQWKRNGTAISGATSSAYVIASADNGAAITCTVTATNSGGSGSATSNNIGPIGSIVATYDSRFGTDTATAANTGWFTFALKSGNRRVWVDSSKADDTGNGLTAATAKKTLKAGWAVYLGTGYQPGDQFMIAGGASQTYTDDGTIPNWDSFGGYSIAYPNAVMSYDSTDPANTTLYGRLTGAKVPKITQQVDSSTGFFLNCSRGTGTNYYAIQGIEITSVGESDRGFGFLGVHDGVCVQNCRFNGVGIAFNSEDGSHVPTSQRVNISKSSFWGAWSTGGSYNVVFIGGHDGLWMQDVVIVHPGWKIGAARTDAGSVGGPSALGHGYYYHAANSNGRFDRIIGFDGAADVHNVRGQAVCTDLVDFDSPIALTFGGYSNSYTERTAGALSTLDDFVFGGGSYITTSVNCGINNNSTIAGSYAKNGVFFDNPIKAAGTGGDKYVGGDNTNPTFTQQLLVQNCSGYNYSTHLFSGGADGSGGAGTNPLKITFQGCKLDVAVSTTASVTDAGSNTTGTFAGAITRQELFGQLLTTMGLTPSGTYAGVKKQIVDLACWRPDLDWARYCISVALPAFGRTPSRPLISPPNLASETPQAIY